MGMRKTSKFVRVWNPEQGRLVRLELPSDTEEDLRFFQSIVDGNVEMIMLGGIRCMINEQARVDGRDWFATRFVSSPGSSLILGNIIFLSDNEAKLQKLAAGGFEVCPWSPRRTDRTPFRESSRSVWDTALNRRAPRIESTSEETTDGTL